MLPPLPPLQVTQLKWRLSEGGGDCLYALVRFPLHCCRCCIAGSLVIGHLVGPPPAAALQRMQAEDGLNHLSLSHQLQLRP